MTTPSVLNSRVFADNDGSSDEKKLLQFFTYGITLCLLYDFIFNKAHVVGVGREASPVETGDKFAKTLVNLIRTITEGWAVPHIPCAQYCTPKHWSRTTFLSSS